MSAGIARDELAALATRRPDFSQAFTPVIGSPRHAAVLILFGELDTLPEPDAVPALRNVDVLLLRRASTLRSHAGQVAFPGGALEDGESAVQAALREAVEETGLDPGGVQVLGELPPVAAAVSSHLVTPVLAWWTRVSEVVAVDHAETVEVFRVPVADLLDPENRVTSRVERMGFVFESPGFLVADTFVWGFTGKLLDEVFTELGWTEPWDRSRRHAVPDDMLDGRTRER